MSAAAFLNSASKGLGIAKQFALQKAGKATASAEDPEFLAACERLRVAENNFKNLSKIGKSVYDQKELNLSDDAKAFLNSDIKAALKLKSDYDLAKLDCDAKRSSLNSLRQKPETKQEKVAAAEVS